jgi:hypothetical protein
MFVGALSCLWCCASNHNASSDGSTVVGTDASPGVDAAPGSDGGVNAPDATPTDGAEGFMDAAPFDVGPVWDGGQSFTCVHTAPVTPSLLWSPLGSINARLVLDDDKSMILSFPPELDPSVKHVSGATLAASHAHLISVVVSGSFPPVSVLSAAYDRTLKKEVLLAYSKTKPGDGGIGDHMELLVFALDSSGASGTLSRLLPTNTPPTSQGFAFSDLEAEGDGVHFRAFRFTNSSARAAISADLHSVSWEPEVMIVQNNGMPPTGFEPDRAHGRLLAYGKTMVQGVPPNLTITVAPAVFALDLAGGLMFSELPAAGQPPPIWMGLNGQPPPPSVGELHYDEAGNRLVVLMDHPVNGPFGMMNSTGIWSYSASGVWTPINDDLGRCCAMTGVSFIQDRAHRRALLPSSDQLSGVDLSPGNEGALIQLPADARLQITLVSAALDSHRGRILAVDTSGLIGLSLTDPHATWTPIMSGAVPMESAIGHSLIYDAQGDRLVMFGGRSATSNMETAHVYTLDLSSPNPSWVMASTQGPSPPARESHSATYVGANRTMIAAGGFQYANNVITDLTDVLALDLSTLTWRPLGQLPAGRTRPLLHVSSDGSELDVLFGDVHTTPSDPFTTMGARDGSRVDVAHASVSPLAITGPTPPADAPPTLLDRASGPLIFAPESDGIGVYALSFSAAGASSTRTISCEDPRVFYSRFGLVDQSDVGYLLGETVWKIAP